MSAIISWPSRSAASRNASNSCGDRSGRSYRCRSRRSVRRAASPSSSSSSSDRPSAFLSMPHRSRRAVRRSPLGATTPFDWPGCGSAKARSSVRSRKPSLFRSRRSKLSLMKGPLASAREILPSPLVSNCLSRLSMIFSTSFGGCRGDFLGVGLSSCLARMWSSGRVTRRRTRTWRSGTCWLFSLC